MRRIVILGSAGSIGVQALDVVRQSVGSEHELQVVGLSTHSQIDVLRKQAIDFNVKFVCLTSPDSNQPADDDCGKFLDSIDQLLDETSPDLVLNAIVGFAGLSATLAALNRGIDVALANKESLVSGGHLCRDASKKTGAKIIPVDSEHSAMAQCFAGAEKADIESLVLTASGGPFFGYTKEQLANVSVEQALDHPTWNMGGKITIDSATLMNKGLELIEACVLFDLTEDQVETVVHRHSIVHAMVRHNDGSLVAHLGWPDMRVPINWALNYPYRVALESTKKLDLVDMPALEFFPVDREVFPAIDLARKAMRMGPAATCALNAANEVAVELFMNNKIPFGDIFDVVDAGILNGQNLVCSSFDEVKGIDALVRHSTLKLWVSV